MVGHLSAMHFLAADGVGPRNSCWIMLFRLLIFIFFCRGRELIAAEFV